MRRFRFRLQVALDHAARLEESAKLALAAAMAERAEQARALEGLLGDRDRVGEELLARQTGALDLPELERLRAHLEELCNRIAEQRQAIADSDRVIETRRDQLVDCMKRRQVLERLRSIQLTQHRQRELALETKELDDIAAMRHNRRGATA